MPRLLERSQSTERFDYLLANPPFGVDWKELAGSVKPEHETQGLAGRFGAGLSEAPSSAWVA